MRKAMRQASVLAVLKAMRLKQCRQDKTRQHKDKTVVALSCLVTLGNARGGAAKNDQSMTVETDA